MSEPSVFGEIPGYPEGTAFTSREEVRRAGLHRHEQGGISGNYTEGADAIVVSGGYVDDKDFGDVIIYTGQGGREGRRQIRDQELTRGNLALVRSEQSGLPVRVIRGATGDSHAPATGYRYDGLYTVSRHWQDTSVDGPRIWRYVLEKADGGDTWQNTTDRTPPTGAPEPNRRTSVVQRIVRNSAVTQWVKNLYDGVCQICGAVLETWAGHYSEGAHIRALGSPHDGPDTPDNVLCLCPNDHVLLDKGALYLRDGGVFRAGTGAFVTELTVHPNHSIDWSHADYHREHFAGS